MRGKKRKKRLSIGIYPRKLAFFAVLFLCAYAIYGVYSNSKTSADSAVPVSEDQYTSNSQTINLELTEDGKVYVDGEDQGIKLSPVGNSDELRLPIVDQPDKYIKELTIKLTLPKPVASKVTKQILAIHGVDSAYYRTLDESTIEYKAYGVAQTATVSIVADFPKGIISRSIWQEFISSSSESKFSFWIYLALIIPVLTFAFMAAFIAYMMKINHIEKPTNGISSPPMAIPPALVGVLYHQQVTPREIAATLVDLALRKDIYILDRERGFAFGKGRFDQRLLGYEKMLLAKIFKTNMSTASQEMLETKVQSQLYSKKISLVSAGVYGIATRLGYFRQNPRSTHKKFWLFGIIAITISLIGFILSFVLNVMPSFTAFFWVGMAVAIIIILTMVKKIPMRTEIGKDALANWLAFRKFMSDPNPIEYSPTVHQLFEAYLPYAIVLECEAAWARRFYPHTFMVPDWFITDKNGLGLEDFCLALFPIISYISRSLSALREPGFE